MSNQHLTKVDIKQVRKILNEYVKKGKLVKFKRNGKVYYQEVKAYLKVN
jgi:hypothetical protein